LYDGLARHEIEQINLPEQQQIQQNINTQALDYYNSAQTKKYKVD
jgi:hypothetical protein